MEMTAIVGFLLVFSTLSSWATSHRRAGTSNRGRKVRNRIDYSTAGGGLQAPDEGFYLLAISKSTEQRASFSK